MKVLVGEEFFKPSECAIYRVKTVSKYEEFIVVETIRPGEKEWVLTMNPIRMSDFINDLKNRVIIPNTEAGRLFYGYE